MQAWQVLGELCGLVMVCNGRPRVSSHPDHDVGQKCLRSACQVAGMLWCLCGNSFARALLAMRRCFCTSGCCWEACPRSSTGVLASDCPQNVNDESMLGMACPSLSVSVCVSVCLYVCLRAWLAGWLAGCLSVCLSVV